MTSRIFPMAVRVMTGTRLLAGYNDSMTVEAVTYDLTTGRARDLTGKVDDVGPATISRDGQTVLARSYDEDAASEALVTIPFRGGPPSLLATDAWEADWAR